MHKRVSKETWLQIRTDYEIGNITDKWDISIEEIQKKANIYGWTNYKEKHCIKCDSCLVTFKVNEQGELKEVICNNCHYVCMIEKI